MNATAADDAKSAPPLKSSARRGLDAFRPGSRTVVAFPGRSCPVKMTRAPWNKVHVRDAWHGGETSAGVRTEGLEHAAVYTPPFVMPRSHTNELSVPR